MYVRSVHLQGNCVDIQWMTHVRVLCPNYPWYYPGRRYSTIQHQLCLKVNVNTSNAIMVGLRKYISSVWVYYYLMYTCSGPLYEYIAHAIQIRDGIRAVSRVSRNDKSDRYARSRWAWLACNNDKSGLHIGASSQRTVFHAIWVLRIIDLSFKMGCER